MALPTYFTCSDLIRYCGGNDEWAKDPRLTGAISEILKENGFTQRHVHHNGNMERQWSKRWNKFRKAQTNGDPERKAKEDLIERIKFVMRVG